MRGPVLQLDVAAGVTVLIKAALVVRDGEIPPVANFVSPNPHMALENSPFRIPTELVAWEAAGAKRRAGVSSFGVGGTNAHVVLEQAPDRDVLSETSPDRTLILPLSARNEAALAAMRKNLAEVLRDSNVPLGFISLTENLMMVAMALWMLVK